MLLVCSSEAPQLLPHLQGRLDIEVLFEGLCELSSLNVIESNLQRGCGPASKGPRHELRPARVPLAQGPGTMHRTMKERL